MKALELLTAKDDKQAHALCMELAQQSEETGALYSCFEGFLTLLEHPKTYVRVRGFRMICALAKWDSDGLIEKHLPQLLAELEDEKATSVRQCLSVLPKIASHQPHLQGEIRSKLLTLELSKYRDSMQPLLQKDIAAVLSTLNVGEMLP
ncbi:MAG: hypothetical protein ACI3VU_03160 [Faecousia sp.]|nr:SufBD protein [Bacillota bacterium]